MLNLSSLWLNPHRVIVMDSTERALIRELTILEEKFKRVNSIPSSELPIVVRRWLEARYGFVPNYIERSVFKVMFKQFKEELRYFEEKAKKTEPTTDNKFTDLGIDFHLKVKLPIDEVPEKKPWLEDIIEKVSFELSGLLIDDMSPAKIADIIMHFVHFATMEDTEEVYYYKDGRYVPGGEVLIGKIVQEAFRKVEVHARLSKHYVNEVIGHIQRSTYVKRSEFDKDLWIVNVKNGLLDLKTLELKPHTPEYLSMIQIPVEWDPSSYCPIWDKFLYDVVDEEDVDILQEFVGYTLWRDCRFQKALMLVGSGSNGKSTFLQVIIEMLGRNNCSFRSLHELTTNRFAAADLFMKLANIYDDLSSETLQNTGIFKIIVAGNEIQAEKKFKNAFTFYPFAKLIFSANKVPSTYDDTQAFYRRWIIVNFPRQFTDNNKDPHILDKLTTPECLRYVLRWAVEGLRRLLKQGDFSQNVSFEELQEQYLRASSPVYAFVQDVLEEGSGDDRIPKDELYAAFIKYCESNKLPKVSKITFGKLLQKYIKAIDGWMKVEGRSVRAWVGIRFKDEFSDQIKSKKRTIDNFVGGG